MTTRNLDKLLQPAAIAVIGASNTPLSVGNTVMRNLLAGGFQGAIMPVNPKHTAVDGVLASAQETMSKEMGKLTQGMGLPGGMGLPF